jgi:hypothetical protein
MDRKHNYFEDADDEALSARIVEFAREYRAGDFPNPARKNCPSDEAWSQIAVSGKLPEPQIRKHLLNCSPCLRVFRAARESIDAVSPAVRESGRESGKTSWFGVFLKPFPAVGLFLLIAALAGAIIYPLFFASETEIVRQRPENRAADGQHDFPGDSAARTGTEDSPPAPNQNRALSAPVPDQPVKSRENRGSAARPAIEAGPPAGVTISLDLAKAAVSRNVASSETIYRLPARAASFNIKLIAHSPAGDYEISLLDESGRPLVKKQTKSSSGKNLKFTLDIPNKSGRARLCVAPKDEIPDCFAVRIGAE